MFKSIRWKFITIYFLLVFMAMVIIGVFLMQQFEQYHLGVVSNNLSSLANTVTTTLKTIDWQNNPAEVEKNIRSYEQMGTGIGITIIKNDANCTIVFSTNASYMENNGDANATRFLDSELILSAFNGEIGERDSIDQEDKLNSSKHMVFPIHDNNNRIGGAIYLKSNLEDIYKTLEESRSIILKATFLALFVTIILGFFIAKSITGPINDVTIKAERMAKGDFEQVVEVRSDDEIGQLASMFNYLTARLNAVLQEMSNEKKKMDTIITYMADGLVAATREGKVIHVNPKAMEMLKIDDHTPIEKDFNEIFASYSGQLKIEELLSDSEDSTGNRMINTDNGVILQANYAPFMDQNGALEGIILVLQDITNHQKLENMRKEFVANVSHELKTPLTTIKSYTETLLDGVIDNKELAVSFLQVVDSESERMTRLVRDLLQLSNLDFHQSKWNKKVVDLKQIVEKTILKLEVSAKNKNQQIHSKLTEKAVNIYADEDRIEQVVLNLLSNSIKYTPEGGAVYIDVELNEHIVLLKIKDNGIGIPKEDIPRIFERFYRVDKARSRELGGTGLGLSIAQQIIEAHEGTIEIFSEEGKGTEAVIKLPIIETEAKMCNSILISL
ncbi:cell wall metabolism sensor histidine kinase WalK [Alkaliphilus sp. MSJ-5]|uniref:histidine kinase n=2 Tax=Alkaliphilus flagellatus TaxID=2841507 RepID=A0ABS6G2F5_9FIRM|nr:cell wall metabolism sensor histidine kinase WalK [Alkaliphilus flagellatus]